MLPEIAACNALKPSRGTDTSMILRPGTTSAERGPQLVHGRHLGVSPAVGGGEVLGLDPVRGAKEPLHGVCVAAGVINRAVFEG